ncbi:MAG: hypothetical protein GY925_04805, partial [Actinomycetia bacterium]|nr:hypothetical protein [Actinomycetes bacterium]
RAATWLENQISPDGLIRMPASGVVDYGMAARTIRALVTVKGAQPLATPIGSACHALSEVTIGSSVWSTYPGGEPSTGATSLVLSAIAACPEHFAITPDPGWLLDTRNDNGGWGEYDGSPSRIDNTFWAYRGCLACGHQETEGIDPTLLDNTTGNAYDVAMAQRLRVLVGLEPDDRVTPLAMKSLNDDADRYAETALFGLAVSEPLQAALDTDADAANREQLPVRTPDFLRREPPLYDQLANASAKTWWMRTVERAARTRVAESSIGWLAGV